MPGTQQVAAWSRILYTTEVVMCLNTSGTQTRSADVTIDASLHENVASLKVLYRSDWTDAQLKNPPTGETVAVNNLGGRRTIHVQLPAAGMLILSA